MSGPERSRAPELSIVLPVLDEAPNLPTLWRELEAVLANLGRSAEIIFVDDGSTDASAEVIGGLIQQDPRIRLLRFKGHAGLTAAFDAGFRAARGRIVVTMDSDLQNDPRDIGPMLARLESVDAVVGWRQIRADRWSKRLSSRVANAIRNWVTGDVVNDSACSLRAMRRECLSALPPFQGMHRFVPTLLRMSGYRVAEMIVEHRPRRFGRSKFGIRNRARVAFEDLLAVRWMLARRLHYSVVDEIGGSQVTNTDFDEPGNYRDNPGTIDRGAGAAVPEPGTGRAIRWALPVALLAACALALLTFDLGGWIFESNDEARFPVMARDVLANGNWLFPEIAGVPMLNKPPLHAWLIALSSLPAGEVTPRSAVLPSALGAVGVVLATAWLGAQLFGMRVGVTAGFMTVTTAGVFVLARSPVPDMTLTLAITGAMAALGLAEFEQRRHALIAFYGFTGLAFLAKGPPGLIPLAAALAFELLAHGPKGIRRLVSVPGLALLALLIVPWSLLALWAGEQQFVQRVIVKDMRSKYFGLGGWRLERLIEPLKWTLTLPLPWSILAPFAAWSAARESGRDRARPAWLALVWAATVFVLVGMSERQRSRYYLPLCPPIALLVASWFCRLQLRHRTRIVAQAGAAALILLTFGVGYRMEATRRDRLTDLSALRRELESAAAPIFAVDSPDIVFNYYLNRPVTPLSYYSQFERAPGPAYLIASERAARSETSSVTRLATSARVNGRTFVLLKK
jgi:4-amino-4-deoxy-L-arabinose transferase-like glycosyltransferase